jgi:hypothetical protein
MVSLLQGQAAGPAEEVVPDADGFYRVQMSLQGVPNESAQWTVMAFAPKPNDAREAEARGRIILLPEQGPITIAQSFKL